MVCTDESSSCSTFVHFHFIAIDYVSNLGRKQKRQFNCSTLFVSNSLLTFIEVRLFQLLQSVDQMASAVNCVCDLQDTKNR